MTTTTTIIVPQPAAAEPEHLLQPPQGTEEELVIVVTLEDIQRGRRSSSYRCPVALAVRRQVGNDELSVGVTTRIVRIGDDDDKLYAVSRELIYWITRFDQGQAMHPERFVLKRAHPFVPTRPH